MRYHGYRAWNFSGWKLPTGQRKRAKWLLRQPIPRRLWTIQYHRKTYYLLKGKLIYATIKVGPDFHFPAFLRWCKKYISKKRKKRIYRDNFHRTMQFYTAYWYTKEQDDNPEEYKQYLDDVAFDNLMRTIRADTSPTWTDIIDTEDDSEAERKARLRRMLDDDT